MTFASCMFFDCQRDKQTTLWTNVPAIYHALAGSQCRGNKLCNRTGLPHLSWKGPVRNGIPMAYHTAEEAAYPQGPCEALAKAILEWWPTRPRQTRTSFVFSEVFAGPRAPLTAAVKRAFEAAGHG